MQKPTRYIVHHHHQAYPNAPVEQATVSYSTHLDNALNLAIHTASRYHGEIYAEYPGAESTFVRVKDYRRQFERELDAMLAAQDELDEVLT